jgi:hypothetical protein
MVHSVSYAFLTPHPTSWFVGNPAQVGAPNVSKMTSRVVPVTAGGSFTYPLFEN